jgi:hypothetical protein
MEYEEAHASAVQGTEDYRSVTTKGDTMNWKDYKPQPLTEEEIFDLRWGLHKGYITGRTFFEDYDDLRRYENTVDEKEEDETV